MAGVNNGIVAGYDGSPDSAEALRWAAREAEARGTTLTVCVVWAPDYEESPTDSGLCDLARRRGREILDRALPYAESVLGPGQVRAALVGGSAARVLCERSRGAEMVVIGSRGRGALPGWLLGSVSWQVAAHASGRVVVVRGRWRPVNESPGPVVVGVDGSAAAPDAVAFAVEEAALRGVPVVAVCALADSAGRLGESYLLEEDFSRVMSCAEKAHPEVTVLRQVTAGPPRLALLAAADGAQLLVLGARGRGGLDDMLLGSVTQVMLHHTPCPVGVVHPGVYPT
jgi:nucleotide-binding universal stress UspA family protein